MLMEQIHRISSSSHQGHKWGNRFWNEKGKCIEHIERQKVEARHQRHARLVGKSNTERSRCSMKPFIKKRKQPKSICVAAFPEQFRRLHPERGAAGGVKGRSKPKEVLDAVYSGIADLFKRLNPWCSICPKRGRTARPTEDIHHSHGKDGLLYFYVKWFIPACRDCHSWAGDNVAAARALGVTAPEGEWNKQP